MTNLFFFFFMCGECYNASLLTFKSYDPIFTQIYSSTNTLRPVSLWKAIDLIGSYPELEPPNSGVKTFELLRLIEYNKTKNPGRPIVIFPEVIDLSISIVHCPSFVHHID